MSDICPVSVLALNPALDVSYEVPQLIADQKVRAHTTRYHPGGNGINVARALASLKTPMRCVSIIGGKSGDLLLRLLGDTLGEEGHRVFETDGETRLNATILQQHPPGQYEVDSTGPEVSAELLERVEEEFLSGCGEDVAVLTGSLPPGVPEDTYGRLTEKIQARGGKAVVDAHGPALKYALEAGPRLVRVNRYVLEMSIKRRLDAVEDVAATARELHAKGVGLVCVSLAAQGAVLVGDENAYHCPAPRVRLSSTVGSGDAMIAGLVAANARGDTLPDILRFGVACGTATAAHPGTELFDPDEVPKLCEGLEVRALDI